MTQCARVCPTCAAAASQSSTTKIGASEQQPDVMTLLEKVQQVTAVAGFEQGVGAGGELLVVDEPASPRHLLGHTDFQSLPTLEGAHVVAGVEQGAEGSGVQPGGAGRQRRGGHPARVGTGGAGGGTRAR